MFKLNPIFSDGAILQANKSIRIFGEGDERVTVTVNNDTVEALSKNGKWCAELPAHAYGEICSISVKSENSEISLSNVTFGDVYLLAGQSNMQFKLFEAIPDGDIYECDNIRLFSTDRMEDNEHFKSSDGWVKCDKESAPNFSAIGYFVARELHKKNNRPIGLVSLYQGASVIQSWLSESALAELNINIPPEELHWDHHNPDFSKWNGNSTLYNFAFSQIIPFSFSDVLWYQGESNAAENESKIYDKMLEMMIKNWRKDLLDENLHFVIIQIADCDSRAGESWSRVQRAQELVGTSFPSCSFVKCADICETDNIHPPTKHILAKRIAQIL